MRLRGEGVQEVLMGCGLPDALLCPPDAVGDESRSLTPAQLANQVWQLPMGRRGRGYAVNCTAVPS